MAKIKHPLHSLSASGSIGGVLSFRATKGGAVCAVKPGSYMPDTTQQLANQQMMRDARTSFKALTPAELSAWQDRALAVKLSTWCEYFREYQNQQVIFPAQPLIPAPFL